MKRNVLILLFVVLMITMLGCSETQYDVNFDSNGGSNIESIKVNEGELISIPDVNREGYVLEGWYMSLNEGDTFNEKWSFLNNTVQSNMTLYAKWEVDQFTLSFLTNDDGFYSELTFDYGSNISHIPEPSRTGYSFEGWFTDSALTIPFNHTTMPAEDINLYPKWDELSLRIGVILPDASEQRWANLDGAFFEEELAKLGEGYDYEILFSEGNESIEIANAEALIAQGVDVIILASTGSGAPVADLVAETEGVTLIAHDRMAQSNTEKADFYTTFNAWNVGKAQGQHLVDMAIENDCSATEPCDLAIFAGRTADWPNATYFFGGAMEVIVPNMDLFELINVSTADLEALVTYVDTNGVITQANFDDDAKSVLQDAMATVDTNWNAETAGTLAAGLVATLDGDYSNEDVYVLAPNDDTSAAIRLEFAKLEDNAYENYYTTGQDASNTAIASLMGDPVAGQGTQTMTVFKDVSKLVVTSVHIAKNVIDGVDGLTGLNSGQEINGVPTAYAPLDILLASYPQKTYDLIFKNGYKNKENYMFENIDFTIYEDDE